MSVSAHRINHVDFEVSPTFNLVLDTDVIDALEELGHWLQDIGYRIALEDLQTIINQCKDNELVCGHFKRDLRWAQIREKQYVYYHIIGDIDKGGT